MGVSGGTVTKGPAILQFRAPILPLITVITPVPVTITWADPFPDDTYLWRLDDEDLIGKATATMTEKTATGMKFRIDATIQVGVGSRLFVWAWA